MERDILAVDVGTTAFKMGIYDPDLRQRYEASRRYDVNLYDGGKADIEPEKWWQAFRECCGELRDWLPSIGLISFSVTTPGLVPMAEDGTALGPAILFFDGRSHLQSRRICERVGEAKFLSETCNLPVSGGSSLSSILWIRDELPHVWSRTAKFGHCNTYMVKRLTGEWSIDPSTTSITGMYNSARHDLTWNQDVLAAADLPEQMLPPLMQSYHKAGDICRELADELGLPRDCEVLCGGNDATLAALSGGLTELGDINNICGTCEITNVCVDHPVGSPNFNVRCHAIPNRWITFFVLNTGGKALEWFHEGFCREMTEDEYYRQYIPRILKEFFAHPDRDKLDSALPVYEPFLQGSRYTLEQLTASFSGLNLETTREKMLLGLIKGNATYHGEHLREVARMVPLGKRVMTSGGGARIEGFLEVKKRWTGDFEYGYQEQSSLLGAAMLGQFFREKTFDERYPQTTVK